MAAVTAVAAAVARGRADAVEDEDSRRAHQARGALAIDPCGARVQPRPRRGGSCRRGHHKTSVLHPRAWASRALSAVSSSRQEEQEEQLQRQRSLMTQE